MQMQLEQAKIQQKQQEAQLKAQVEMQTTQMKTQADLTKVATDDAIKQKEIDVKFLEVMTKIQNADLDAAIQQEKADAERSRSAVDLAISVNREQREHEKHLNGE